MIQAIPRQRGSLCSSAFDSETALSVPVLLSLSGWHLSAAQTVPLELYKYIALGTLITRANQMDLILQIPGWNWILDEPVDFKL